MSNSRLGLVAGLSLALLAAGAARAAVETRPELQDKVVVVRDARGIAHIDARNAHDLYFMQGWIHAGDRLFQMDITRRQPGGTLAELFGPSQLAGDVEARIIGLRRAAVRSYPVLSEETRRALEAYAEGVNAWVAEHPLPPEYALLGLSGFEPWTPVDSVVIGKAITFSLSFDLDTGLTESLTAYLEALGPQGYVLFTEDAFRSQPFDCASTVPDATGTLPYVPVPTPGADTRCDAPSAAAGKAARPATAPAAGTPGRALGRLAEEAGARLRRSDFLRERLDDDGVIGSNEWGVGRARGANGRPLVANDPHLALNMPSTFYPIHLAGPGVNVYGSSFAGAPFVVLGHNRQIHWGATTNPMDVTDTFLELVAFDPQTGLPAATLFQGNLEPVEVVPETFRVNAGGGNVVPVPPGVCGLPGCGGVTIPPATFIVPRRNQGPLIAFFPGEADPSSGLVPALSVQYTGFSATRELDTFRMWNEARNLREFRAGLDYFDFGSQNWVYGDVAGNVAYFTSAEMPLRADLQSGTVAPGSVPGFFPPGLPIPPWLIRDGTSGAHEWLPVTDPQPGQAIPYEILPYDEMPQAVNPATGWFVNANNDPAGTTLDNDPLNQLRQGGNGIYYLNPGYSGGFRAGTITRRLQETVAAHGQVSLEDMQRIQADVTLLDAAYFVPWILQAWDNANAPGADPALAALVADARIGEAVGRLAEWDLRTPTGLAGGYDAGDDPAALPEPDDAQIAASVAATLYSVWRGQAIRLVVDDTLAALGVPAPGSTQAVTALRNLLDNFAARQGLGASGVNFFQVPGVGDPVVARDVRLLGAMQAALDRLAGPDFAPAFGGSTDQDDYRWGRLHWIVFDHPFVPAFGVPPAAGAFPPPVAGVPGIPTDGGFNVVDASSHSARADDWDDFSFGSGPVRRYTAEPQAAYRSRARSIWAGGTSGVPGSPFYANLLPLWLTNHTLDLSLRVRDALPGAASVTRYLPGD